MLLCFAELHAEFALYDTYLPVICYSLVFWVFRVHIYIQRQNQQINLNFFMPEPNIITKQLL